MLNHAITSPEVAAYEFAVRLGFDGTRENWEDSLAPVTNAPLLDATADLTRLKPNVYRVPDADTARSLHLPMASPGHVDKLDTSITSRIFRFRTHADDEVPSTLWMAISATRNGPPGPWWLISGNENDGSTPAERIKRLARIDGWTAVYDPTDPDTTTVNEDGCVVGLADGLGNHAPLANFGNAPQLLQGAYGQLHGIKTGDGVLAVSFGANGILRQPNTIMAFGAVETGASGKRFLVDGVGKRRHAIFSADQQGAPLNSFAGVETANTAASDSRPHLITATFGPENAILAVDSSVKVEGTIESNSRALGGLTLGGDHKGRRQWSGSVGPVLVYHGEIPPAVQARMENLLYELSGLNASTPQFPAEAAIYSVDGSGRETFSHGDVHAVSDEWEIASITKLMMAWVARQTLTTDELLSETITITRQDRHKYSYRRFVEDDVVTYADLLRAVMASSDNTAPYVIARGVGERLPGVGSPVERFVQAMNDTAADLGYTGASFSTPWNYGKMSAAQVTDLHRHILDDPFLVDALGTFSRDITIDGPQARAKKTPHRVVLSPTAPLAEMVTAKTGTWPVDGRAHVTFSWQHPDGSTHVTTVLNVDPGEVRYRLLQNVMTYVKSR
ncbi:serine hydrolase [Micrococcaceae sp. AOP34-BR2-30]